MPNYQQNDLWQKIQKNIQNCQTLLNQAEQEYKDLKINLFLWLDYWKRELKIIELEADIFNYRKVEDWDLKALAQQEMKALIQANQALKKQLKNHELN